MTMTSRVRERADGVLSRERILDWMRRSGISPEQIEQARLVLPDSLHPDRHDHLLAPFGFDRDTRVERIIGDP